MSITYLCTSIFDSPARTLVCPVNCVGVMGAGLALEFKRRFPEMYERCRRVPLAPGSLFVWNNPLADRPDVLCFPTKGHWRDRSTLTIIADGLHEFVENWQVYASGSIAFPKLGCGLGWA